MATSHCAISASSKRRRTASSVAASEKLLSAVRIIIYKHKCQHWCRNEPHDWIQKTVK